MEHRNTNENCLAISFVNEKCIDFVLREWDHIFPVDSPGLSFWFQPLEPPCRIDSNVAAVRRLRCGSTVVLPFMVLHLWLGVFHNNEKYWEMDVHCFSSFNMLVPGSLRGVWFSLAIGGLFFAKTMRDRKYLTMMDPFQHKYGNVLAGILAIIPVLAEVAWVSTTDRKSVV